MKKLSILFTTALLFFFACQKDAPAPTADKPSDPKMAAIESRLAKALAVADALLADKDDAAADRNNVTLPAGSVNGLAAAIAAAGPGGKVTVACGNHYESGTVEITFPVKIVGQSGAVFHWSGLQPADPEQVRQDPAIYAKNTNDVTIKKLEFRAESGGLRTCILLENVPDAKIQDNKIYEFQMGIICVNVDNAKISKNYLDGPGTGLGIGVVSGAFMLIADNEVFDFDFPIFPSGSYSDVVRNKTHQAFFGIILCQLDVDMPDGINIEGPVSTNHFLFSKNESYNCAWGIIAIDGAFDNVLFKNNTHDNSTYDIELVGESDRFGPPAMPTSSNTTVVSNGNLNNVLIKDCAPGSVIIGGTLVDTNADPCF
ncbi:MAG: right-handed parallel beta-helix repeat-containing protein [Lewinellaceae bacterium]|nr:right-handed parallel beta-helix repeat-containing protein [Lewinellaceae bacterium]